MLMTTVTMSTEFESRAADELRALLARFSAIKLVELKHESQSGKSTALLARVSVYGHSHTLACDLNSSGDPARIRAAFRVPRAVAAPHPADAVPVLIAPCLSPEAQALCKERQIGFLDFEGNARLTVGDFFIVMRSMPRAAAARVSAVQPDLPALVAVDPLFPNVLPKVPGKQPSLALSA
jgi:hypothetical protein